MKLLRTTALTATLMTAAVPSLTSPALAQDWGWGWRGGGWGWPGASVGALATRAVVGSAAARNYSYGYPAYGYGYGYPAYSYGSGYSYPAQARLAWWGWPGLVTAGAAAHGYGYGTGYNYPAYAYGYGSGYGYPASGYVYHPVIRRHIASRPRIRHIYAAGAGVRRHWQ